MTAPVCGARAAAWGSLTQHQRLTRPCCGDFGPARIPCDAGCGAKAGEPCANLATLGKAWAAEGRGGIVREPVPPDALPAIDSDRLRRILGARDGESIEEAAERVSTAVADFQRGSGCVDGATIADALNRIGRLLGRTPTEGIPDAATRTVRGRDAAVAMVRELVAAAYPHPVEHPTMWAAWAKAKALLKVTP